MHYSSSNRSQCSLFVTSRIFEKNKKKLTEDNRQGTRPQEKEKEENNCRPCNALPTAPNLSPEIKHNQAQHE